MSLEREELVPENSDALVVQNYVFMSNVYLYMMLGILVTAITSLVVMQFPDIIAYLMSNKITFFGLLILQLVVVGVLSVKINSMSAFAALISYVLYAVLVGITFAVILYLYTAESIATTFFLTAFSFSGLSLFGYVTKRDLGPIGSFCMIGLFGLIGIMLLSFFVPALMSESVQFAVSVIGILVFAGLTAYDTQKIKNFNIATSSIEQTKKQVLLGALTLYLDFINLFLMILRLVGNRK